MARRVPSNSLHAGSLKTSSGQLLKPDRRWFPHAVLLVVACGAVALRTRFLVGGGGALASPTDYDDGVYFSASALLFRGVLPYRDFVFVHPPGIAWFYGLVSWWPDAGAGFAAARWLACFLGGVNTYLAGQLVLRAGGLSGAVTAAVLYAVYPEVVGAETSTFLEPVLNLACLLSAAVWLSTTEETPRRALLAGLLAGAGCAVKLLGGIWVVAALLSPPRGRFAPASRRFLAAGIAAGALLVAPVALFSPASFFAQVVLFQVSRPPDGTFGAAARLPLVLDNGHLLATLLAAVALAGIGVAALRFRGSAVSREERFFAAAALLTGATFLVSSSYWTQYNAYLAASECVLAGLGAARLFRCWSGRAAVPVAVVAMVSGAVLLRPPLRQTLRESRQRATSTAALLEEGRGALAAGGSLFAFDPSWGLVLGRLPTSGDGAPVVVDSYATMLLSATRGGRRYPNVDRAFREAPAQPEVRSRLERSRFLVIGPRGSWQLPEADRKWVRSRTVCMTPGTGELGIWKRVAAPFDGISRTPEGTDVVFREGWFGQEGTGPGSFRWMSGRGVAILPAVPGAGRLYLELELPASASGGATVVLTLDGRPLDRFRAGPGEVVRSYEVEGSGSSRTLVIATDSTVVPSRSGRSGDDRELGMILKRIVFLGREGWSRLTG